MKKSIVALLIVVGFQSNPVAAACEEDLRKYNILGTALLSVGTAALKGNINDFKDFTHSFFYGAVAGYGFHQSKIKMAQSKGKQGIGLAYLSSSIVKNVTEDSAPFSAIHYGVGPFEFRLPTGLGKSHSDVVVETELFELPYFIRALSKMDEFKLKDGMLYHKGYTGDHLGEARGRTIKMSSRLNEGSYAWRSIWNHEAIHVVQHIQLQSFGFRDETKANGASIHFGAGYFLNNIISGELDYKDRWQEIEAYRLAQNSNPSFQGDNCKPSVSLGFSIPF